MAAGASESRWGHAQERSVEGVLHLEHSTASPRGPTAKTYMERSTRRGKEFLLTQSVHTSNTLL